MATHNPWKGDGTPMTNEELTDQIFMAKMAEIAKLDSVEAQLTALNNGQPIEAMDAATLATLLTVACVYADACQRQGHDTQPDVLRSLLGAGFQLLQPLASEAQRALGTIRGDVLPN
ncbi:MAG: hypothetical protein OXI20_10405 [Rhodospirillales bacterium]|nr:hypothetical protein [Rhodospirillales bacterium]